MDKRYSVTVNESSSQEAIGASSGMTAEEALLMLVAFRSTPTNRHRPICITDEQGTVLVDEDRGMQS